MIKHHPSFEFISDDTILWQYMSLTKFLFLIRNRKLHFHRIDDLMDKDEGVLSALDKKYMSFFSNSIEWEEYLENDRKRSFVSCWINYPTEQSLMWYAYGKGGVAIRTSAGDFRRAMEIDEEHEVNMVAVRYINKECESAQIPGARLNWLRFPTTKRMFFEMENEVRLLYFDSDRQCKDKGIDLDIEIEKLILEIKVASTVPEYVFRLICQEVNEAGLMVVPVMSEI